MAATSLLLHLPHLHRDVLLRERLPLCVALLNSFYSVGSFDSPI